MAQNEDQNNVQRFTFVGYDVNATGVSDMVRSHLTQLRARNKREAQAHGIQWRQSQQRLALPWRYVEVEKKAAPPSEVPRRDLIGSISISRDALQNRKPAQISTPASNPSQGSSKSQSPNASPEPSGTEIDKGSPTLLATRINELMKGVEEQLHASVPNAVDFKLSFWGLGESSSAGDGERNRVGHSLHIKRDGQRQEPSDDTHIQAFQSAAIAVPWQLCSSDLALYQYFRENGVMMLRFHLTPEIEVTQKPVEEIFLPIALSARWCFDTLVLLFSAYHQRGSRIDSLEAGYGHQVTAIQNQVLRAARDRISAVVEKGDSNDGDVLAFLFLAIMEFRFGDKNTGAIHLDAWQHYMIMRREYGVDHCSTKCKVAVWWCTAMLLGPDEPSPAFLDCKIVERIRENPARLFRCLAANNSEGNGMPE